MVSRSPAGFLVVGGAMLLYAAVLLFDGTPAPGQRVGGACVLLLASVCILVAEESRFVFDPERKRLSWRRRSLLRRAGGEIPFSEIVALAMESNYAGGERGRGKRLALVTPSGRVQLSSGYTTIVGGQEHAAREIQRLLAAERSVPIYR